MSEENEILQQEISKALTELKGWEAFFGLPLFKKYCELAEAQITARSTALVNMPASDIPSILEGERMKGEIVGLRFFARILPDTIKEGLEHEANRAKEKIDGSDDTDSTE